MALDNGQELVGQHEDDAVAGTEASRPTGMSALVIGIMARSQSDSTSRSAVVVGQF
jgi:hypothetical protein